MRVPVSPPGQPTDPTSLHPSSLLMSRSVAVLSGALARSTMSLVLLAIGLACGSESDPSKPGADLVVTLTGPGNVSTLDTPTYTVRVENQGPDAAADVVASLDLPSGMTPANGASVDVTGGVASWPALASLGSGAAQDFTVTLVPGGAGTGTLSAHAASSTRDPVPGNNDGSSAGARIAVTITALPTSTNLQVAFVGALDGANGSTVKATVHTVNAGPLEATNVSVVLELPDAVGATNLVPADGVRTAGRITWTIATLASGAALDVTVDLKVPLVSATGLTATVTSAVSESQPADNAASITMRAVVDALYTVIGEGQGDNFGWEAEDVGDVNGDGKHDFAISAPENDAGGNNAGRCYVYSGANGALLYTVTGDTPNGQLGLAMAAVGDLNGDGVEEIAFGAPFASTGSAPGYVLVVNGSNGQTLWRFNSSAVTFAGYGVGPAGDLNGDGVPDVLIGAPGRSPGGIAQAGTVFVASGVDGTLFAAVDGDVASATFGSGMNTIGDLNGDQIADFAIGSSAESGGRIRVYSGADGNLLYPALSMPNGGTLGQFWIFPTGDMDGDGLPDIFAADINNATGGVNRGQAYIFSGASGNLIRTFNGESAGDQFGMGRPIADVNGDGKTDLVLAGWLRSEGATASGKMYVVDGATGATLRSLVSTVFNETLGFDVIGVGDVTGDGLTDYIITAGQSINQGRGYLIPGVPLQ